MMHDAMTWTLAARKSSAAQTRKPPMAKSRCPNPLRSFVTKEGKRRAVEEHVETVPI